jgi:hypothetical protein
VVTEGTVQSYGVLAQETTVGWYSDYAEMDIQLIEATVAQFELPCRNYLQGDLRE